MDQQVSAKVVEEIMSAVDSGRWVGNKLDDASLRLFVEYAGGPDYKDEPERVQKIIDEAVEIVEEDYSINVLF